jgi:haloalkane dehalogenase
MWRNLITKYRHQFRFIAPDHAGMGLSDRTPGITYNLQAHVDRCAELIDGIGIKNFSLVAHDWGGAIGMGLPTLKMLTPERIVMLNTAAFRDKQLPWTINLCRIPWLGECWMRLANGFAWPATWMTTVKRLPSSTRRALLAPYYNWQSRLGIARFVQDIPMDETHPTWQTFEKIEHVLPSLKMPTLLVWGLKDFCFDQHFLNRWQEFYPQAKVISYQDAGHYVLEDRPEAIDEIALFLKSNADKLQ